MKNQIFPKINPFKKQQGLTLIEILIVISILMILILLIFFTSFRQLSKGRDGRRKSDLEKIKVAFEDYYNDNNCYPDETVLNDCDGDSFRPYLDTIPCDPASKEPYLYMASDGGICKGYRLLAKLENKDDPAISGAGCDAETGCGYGDPDYNYGVSQGVAANGTGSSGGYTGSTPEYTDDYYCSPEQGPGCSYMSHANAELRNCPKAFDGPTGFADCEEVCGSDPSIMCDPL